MGFIASPFDTVWYLAGPNPAACNPVLANEDSWVVNFVIIGIVDLYDISESLGGVRELDLVGARVDFRPPPRWCLRETVNVTAWQGSSLRHT